MGGGSERREREEGGVISSCEMKLFFSYSVECFLFS